MTFAVPLFLFGLLAGIIPVVLHLINRQRAKDLPFSTLRFLKISVQKTRRRRRVQDLFLMLLRVALLLLIASGLARPTLTSLKSLLGGGALSAVAIVLDNSASMGIIDQGKPRFDTALAAARQILQEVRDGDEVALWVVCGPPLTETGRFDTQHDKIEQMLSACEERGCSYERADLTVALSQARKLLASSKAANKEIYLLTDLQELSWDGMKKESQDLGPQDDESLSEEQRKIRDIPLVVVDCNRAPAPNSAVQGVELEATVPVAGLPIKAVVEVYNPSTIEQQRVVELHVDSTREAASPTLKIPPGQRARHEFLFSFKSGGLHRGEVRLAGDDGNKLDDRRFFTMEVDQGIPVGVVVAQRHEIPYLDDAFYLEQALAPSSTGGAAIRTQFLKPGELLTEPLGGFVALYCVNLPALDADAAERLRTYVEQGGNLFWIAGDNVEVEAYNRMNEQAQKSLLPAPLVDVRLAGPNLGRDTWNVSFLDKTHRALRHLAEPASLYESILVEKHVRMDTKATAEARTLLGLDDGQGLLVQRRVQKGTVTMLGTSTHKTWTNLPLRPIFVPLLALMTFEMAGVERGQNRVYAGSPLVLQFDDQSRPSAVEILPPNGARIQKENRDKAGNLGKSFQYPRDPQDEGAHVAGIYQLNLIGGPRPKEVAFAVNVDPDEMSPAKLDREKFQGYFGQTPVVFAEDPDDLSSTFKWLREGKSLWEWFLGLVLVFLVFETYVSNWFSPKQDDEQSKVPPGMRRLARKASPAPA